MHGQDLGREDGYAQDLQHSRVGPGMWWDMGVLTQQLGCTQRTFHGLWGRDMHANVFRRR